MSNVTLITNAANKSVLERTAMLAKAEEEFELQKKLYAFIAKDARAKFQAYRDAGFNQEQAMELVIKYLNSK